MTTGTTQLRPATLPLPAESETLPCSATQERFWFLDRLDPGNPALNVAVRWNVAGQVNAATFEAAFRAIIARHEILRTRFVEIDGRPFQQVMPAAEFQLPEIDIRSMPPDAQAARIDAISTEDARRPFDLTRPGLLRATLIRLGSDRAILAITAHHIGFDGWSIRNLGRELGEIAAALDAGRDPVLPDLPLQYGDYALWQSEYLAAPAFAEELESWRRRLQDAPYFELEPDFARPPVRTSRSALVSCDLPLAFGERLEAEATRRAMSPFAFGAGVLGAMLARRTGAAEVLFGTQVAGRPDVDLEPLIGVFINDVVLRLRAPATATMEDHLLQARSVVREALAGHTVPFHRLVEALNPRRDAARAPLVSINLILQKAFMEARRYGRFELSSLPSLPPGAMFDLNFVIIGHRSSWRMSLEYNPDLFSAATAEGLLADWRAAFGFAFETAGRPLAEMPAPAADGAPRPDDPVARIEAALAQHPCVAEAALVRVADPDGPRLHAFVVPSEAATLALEQLPGLLLDDLAARLPGAQLPAGISVLRKLPRDAQGRVTTAALPVPPPPAPRPPEAAPPDIEARLAAIWRELLGVDRIAPGDSFFDLGGHSLLTVRLLGRIEQEFGRRLSVAALYQAPTLRGFARRLGAEPARPSAALRRETDWRALVIQPEGEGIPLIAMNNVKITYAITERFGRARPAAAVQIHDATRGEPLPDRSFEEIAAAYADAVRSLQPRGPYALFGVCVHGNLALEVARQLKAAGEEVAVVILRDVWEPAYAERLWSTRRGRMRCRLFDLRRRHRALRRGDISMAAFLGGFRSIRESGLLRLATRLGLIDRVRFSDLDAEQEAFICYLSRARNAHRPAPYDGRVLHFVTEESPRGRGFDPEMGWGAIVTGGLVTRPLPRLDVLASGAFGMDEAAREIEAILAPAEGRP